MTANKFDEGKPRLSLLVSEFLWGVARVREYGVKKYGDPDGWMKVDNALTRYKDALDRHWGRATGTDGLGPAELLDEESGCPHAYMIGCNAMFLAYFLMRQKPVMKAEFPQVRSGASETTRD